MHSFVKVASLIALTTLGLLAPTVYAQELKDAFVSTPGSAAGFRDPIDSLRSLAVGPYPVSNALAPTAMPMAVGPSGLDKRDYVCKDPGYGVCPDLQGCCPMGELCMPNGCCDKSTPWECGGKYCCPYDSCLANGHCGCNDGLYRCGDNCCTYGCNLAGGCAPCPSSYPVDCGDGTCCLPNTVCAPNNKCAPAGGSNPPAPNPPAPNPPAPNPPAPNPPAPNPPAPSPPPPEITSSTTDPSFTLGPVPTNTTTTTTTTATASSSNSGPIVTQNPPSSGASIKETSGSVIAVMAMVVALLIQ
ncbi:hypothetical protein BGZ80_009497 [Entomortierella chlamydospora]|uniref:Uncharacterized protein n=1 Tax=Entomortierella chlamydospora TaxID=101097 RepID=A0A9P6MWS8_9FUNG|nr:hypothetical protein BGZ80_009497 [Entomortierella chlamydospora]